MSKCLTCGEPIEQKKGKRKRLYCSDLCRLRDWQRNNKRPIAVNKPVTDRKVENKQKVTPKVDQAVSGSETEFMGHTIPDGLSGVPLMVWKNDIKKKFKDAKKLPK